MSIKAMLAFTENPKVQRELADLVFLSKQFQLDVSGELYRPVYTYHPEELSFGDMVGHVETWADGSRTFVVSRIFDLEFATEEHETLEWPSTVITEPVQHSWDKRLFETLEVQKFYLTLATMNCVLKLIEIKE